MNGELLVLKNNNLATLLESEKKNKISGMIRIIIFEKLCDLNMKNILKVVKMLLTTETFAFTLSGLMID